MIYLIIINIMDNSRILSRGKSFNFSKWSPSTKYENDCFKQDFIVFKNVLLACKESHISNESNMPRLLHEDIYDSNIVTGVDSKYWEFVLSPQSGLIYKPIYNSDNGLLFWEITNDFSDVNPFEFKTKLDWIDLD